MLNHSIVPVGSTGYSIDNSLRFNDNDTAYLSRTFTTNGNEETWTYSCWTKRGNIGVQHRLFSAINAASYSTEIMINSNDVLRVNTYTTAYQYDLQSTQLFRDASAWYHIVVSVDTTQATASDRIKIYVNGIQLTDFTTASYPALNYVGYVNRNITHNVGKAGGAVYSDGYLAEVNFIDGQALDPSNFGETGDYGEWKPIKYTGTYGTNGFYLDFENSGSLGADVSGNGNNWTPTNLAATDQMLDSPTNNFCTWNPLQRDGTITLSEGNTIAMCSSSSNWQDIATTMAVPVSGKWYWEFLSKAVNQWCDCGIVDANSSDYFGNTAAGSHISQTGNRGIVYAGWGQKGIDGVFTTYGASHTGNDTIGIAVDVDSNIITFYKNGVSQGSINSALVTGTTYLPAMQGSDSNGFVANFGQDSSFAGNKTAQGNADANGIGDFYYTPPTGYLALCTQNLPEPTVVPSEHFNTVLYTGNGGTNAITGTGFQPDWSWIKGRSVAYSHNIYDVIRGANKALYSNATSAEVTDTNDLMSFDADGFTLGGEIGVNSSGNTYVAWNWKANGTGVSNNNGTITSTVSANVDAGFSIVSYTSAASGIYTIGHGLSKPPDLIINKARGATSAWWSFITLIDGSVDYLDLQRTLAKADDSTGLSAPTSSVFSLVSNYTPASTTNIAYCFHSVDGYSKVGSYTGNGSTDGTFVYTGFRPAYVLVKKSNATENWIMVDNKRLGHNPDQNYLFPNLSNAEGTADLIDLVSNGFKLTANNATFNSSGDTFIFIAFAEHPFKYTNAR